MGRQADRHIGRQADRHMSIIVPRTLTTTAATPSRNNYWLIDNVMLHLVFVAKLNLRKTNAVLTIGAITECFLSTVGSVLSSLVSCKHRLSFMLLKIVYRLWSVFYLIWCVSADRDVH